MDRVQLDRLLLKPSYILSKSEMNVLGLTFDSKLNWGPQVSRAIKGANNFLQAIKDDKKVF